MRCSHCRTDFHDVPGFTYLGKDADGEWAVVSVTCSACKRFTVFLHTGKSRTTDQYARVVSLSGIQQRLQVYPKGASRAPVPVEVPADIAADYREACLVLADSPKASAALSRRCLQSVLRQAAGVKPTDLAREIQEVLDGGKLPTYLADNIDAIRNIGNFSAHPVKATSTGEILPVEPQEAGWNLDVLESLFDFYYVQPAVLARKRAALDAKLTSAGKPPLKAP